MLLTNRIERVLRIPIHHLGEEPDVCIIKLGGTVGDIESMPFIEATSQLRRRAGKNNFMQIHVSYVPILDGEQKTKPTPFTKLRLCRRHWHSSTDWRPRPY
jgi:CTP synthase